MYVSSIPRQGRKRLRSNTKLTPWRDTWELEEVGNILLSATSLFALSSTDSSNRPSSSELQYALRKIAVWKARSDQGRIPHSMETTAALAELLYRDYYCDGGQDSSSSTYELRLAYSCALMRGVNGIADNMQQNRTYASSVASLCDMVGLPGWLVDLRHDAAHNDLPSLSSLRLATQTFLVFLQNNYWTPMSTARWELRKSALELLEKYKSASKTKVSSKATPPPQSSSSSTKNVKSELQSEPKEKKQKQGEEVAQLSEEGKANDNALGSDNDSSDTDDTDEEWKDDHDDNIWGKNLGTNQNRFMALFTESTDKKSKGNEKNNNNNNNKNKKKKNIGYQKKKGKTPGEPSPLIHVKKFVKTIPMDIGFQVSLSFLVWGGMGDVQPEGRGALIPGSPASFPCNQEGASKIVNRHKDLIITLCKAWPGFASTLLVHLVDFILVIEDQEKHKAHGTSGDATDNTGEKAVSTNTKDQDNKEMKKMDPGSARKLYFLSSWIIFLLSREFHMNFDKSVAIMEKTDNNGKSGDLNKKHSGQRSEMEANFLRSPAPFNILSQKAHYPLHTLCDRCCPEALLLNNDNTERSDTADDMMQSSSVLKTDATDTASLEVYRLLCEILQNHRVVGLGIPPSLTSNQVKTSTKMISQQPPSPPPCKRHRHSDEEKEDNGTSPMSVKSLQNDTRNSSKKKENNKNGDEQSSSKAEISADKMSLDDLEALLSDTDDDASGNGNTGSPEPMDKHEASSHTKTKEINEINKADEIKKEAPSVWVRCEVWDTCAIGTLPGLPV